MAKAELQGAKNDYGSTIWKVLIAERTVASWRRLGLRPGLLIEGYGDELENDYQSRQIFSNHYPRVAPAQRGPG